MKILIKSTFDMIRRFAVPSLLNITGLTIAFVASILITIKVQSEYSFDSCHADADRIYRLTYNEYIDALPRPFIDAFINSSPHIESGALINPYIFGETYFTVGEDNISGHKEAFIPCYADITNVFSFEMVEGQKDCLSDPSNILIPKSLAQRMFGEEPAIGKQITFMEFMWGRDANSSLTIGGVYKDFPEETQVENAIYTKISDGTDNGRWRNFNYSCFVKLKENVSPKDILASFKNPVEMEFESDDVRTNPNFNLIPLRDIYTSELTPGRFAKIGNPTTPKILSMVALLILLIGIINYANLNMALESARMRKINISKVLGGSNKILVSSVLLEGIIISVLSYLLALFIVVGLHKTNAMTILNVDINPLNNVGTVLAFGIIAILIGVIASLQSAYRTIRLSPALGIKGNMSTAFSNKSIRNILIGLQFFISVVLIVFAIFISKQNKYIQIFDLGYNKENLVIIDPGRFIMHERYVEYRDKLKSHPNIIDIASTTYQEFGIVDQYASWGIEYNSESIAPLSMALSWNFLDMLGIEVLEGRAPVERDDNSSNASFIINKKMQQKYDIKVGDILHATQFGERGRGPVSGIIDDIKMLSLRHENDSEIVFVINCGQIPRFSYIKIRQGADIKEAVNHIEKTIAGIDPNLPVKIKFYDDAMNFRYKKEIEMGAAISLFSILSIIISIIGVFGLVMFECRAREKEVGIRKVFGSSEIEIMKALNVNYIKTLVVSIVLAIPTSYFVVNKWLTNFAYKTSMDWWVFVVGALVVSVVTLATINIQIYRAATSNPAKALKQ